MMWCTSPRRRAELSGALSACQFGITPAVGNHSNRHLLLAHFDQVFIRLHD
jgi:hypothetical protein